MADKPKIRKVTITVYCEESEVEVLQEEVENLFQNSNAALARRSDEFFKATRTVASGETKDFFDFAFQPA